jgi:hypothetical protein
MRRRFVNFLFAASRHCGISVAKYRNSADQFYSAPHGHGCERHE